MEDQDLMTLDESERKLLDLSFQRGAVDKRVRNIALDIVVISAVVIAGAAYGLRAGYIAAITVVMLAVSGLEKISYARTMPHYHTLIQKLVHRVEQLEGTRLTALGTHPAEDLQHRLDAEREARGAQSRPSAALPTHH